MRDKEEVNLEELSPQELKFIQQVQEEAKKSSDEPKKESVEPESSKEFSKESLEESDVSSEDELELEKALKTGYNPDYEGKRKVDPYTWNKIGTLIKSKQDAVSDIKQLKSAVQELLAHNRLLDEKYSKAEEVAYIRARDDFQRQKIEAIKSGDVAEVNRIEQQAEKLLVKPVTIQPKTNQPTQEQLDWAESQREWLNPNNKDMVNAASRLYDEFVALDRQEGKTRTQTEVLNEVAETVKTMPRFAPRFKKSGVQKSKEAGVGSVEAPTRSGSTAKTVTMSVEDKIQFKAIRLADPSFTEADYFKLQQQMKRK